MLFQRGKACGKILQAERPQLLRQVLDPDEGGDGQDWGDDDKDGREDAKEFHGWEGASRRKD